MTDMPTPQRLEQKAFEMLAEAEDFKITADYRQVAASMKSVEIKVAIAQAYIDLARNRRSGLPGAVPGWDRR